MSIVMTAITIDCADPRTQAEFWSAALGWEIESVEVWDAEISRGEKVVQSRESWSNIISAAPNAPRRINFAKVPEGKTVKNRLHFDLKVDDLDTEVIAAGRTRRFHCREARKGSGWTHRSRPGRLAGHEGSGG